MTTCHLANISIRLGRKLKWNPQKEQIIGDDEANQWQAREQRKASRRTLNIYLNLNKFPKVPIYT